MSKHLIFTKEGYIKLKEEYAKLQQERKQAVLTLKAARELGDLSENGLYKAARAQLSSIDYRLERMKYQIAVGIVSQKPSGQKAEIGSTVTLKRKSSLRTVTIVGDLEADPLNNKISYRSPIGKELIGKTVGDIIVVQTPAGRHQYVVEKIHGK